MHWDQPAVVAVVAVAVVVVVVAVAVVGEDSEDRKGSRNWKRRPTNWHSGDLPGLLAYCLHCCYYFHRCNILH